MSTYQRPAGLRAPSGHLVRWVFRSPLPLFRVGLGWLMLGRTFLAVTHVGRRTGTPHVTVAMVLGDDRSTREAVVCSVWGPGTDWIRNLRAGPARRVQIGRDSFVPIHRFLGEEEAFAVAAEFRSRHPWRVRLFKRVLGVDLRSDSSLRAFVETRPFVAFRPEVTS